jgi:magnesium transporter
MKIPKITHKGISFITIKDLTQEQVGFLNKEFGFSILNLEDYLYKTQIPKIEVYDDYTLVVMDIPYIEQRPKDPERKPLSVQNVLSGKLPAIAFPKTPKKKRIHIGEVNFFIGKNYLVVLHDEKTPHVDDFFSLCEKNEELRDELMGKGVNYLMYRLADILVDSNFTYLDDLTNSIDMIDKKLEEKPSATLIEDISVTRRNIVVFETMVKPTLPIFSDLEKGKYQKLNGEMAVYWSNILDHLQKIADRLEDNRELIEGISHSHESLLTVRTNESIKVLTVFTAILLPLTLFASIYGMNIPLPFSHHPHSFMLIMISMGIVGILTILIFRLRDLL